jgi:hypothetical protein
LWLFHLQLEEEEEEEVILPEITPEMEETIRRAIAARSTDVLVDSYRIQISGTVIKIFFPGIIPTGVP